VAQIWPIKTPHVGPPICHKISKYTAAALEDFPWNRGQSLFFILDWRHSTPSDLQSNSCVASKTSFVFRRHGNPILVMDHKDVLVVESSCGLPFLDPSKWLPAPPPPPPPHLTWLGAMECFLVIPVGYDREKKKRSRVSWKVKQLLSRGVLFPRRQY